jgi:hypothetical protein
MTRVSTCLILLLSLALFTPERSFCQEKMNIVVMPFTSSDLSEKDLETITLLFEDNLLKVDSLQVIDQEKRVKVLAFLDPSLLKCADVECALRAAKGLSADTVVLGTVAQRGGTLVISAKSIDVKSGKSVRIESVESVSMADLPRTIRILSSTLLGTPASGESIAVTPETEQETLRRLKALESMRVNLNASIAEIKKERAKAHAWGWAFLGAGAVSAGLTGVCRFMSEQAYENYWSTSEVSKVEYYHRQVILWDTLTMVSAGTGVLTIGCSIPFFLRGPSSLAEKIELKRIETEINKLQNAQGETR